MDDNSKEMLELDIVQERREYFREWRKNNPDKVKAHNQNFYKKRAEKRLQNSTDVK